ncbi:MAG: KpsF/GutQ family sugar-phosphate isomerase [Porticoccaceae bacterium]|jgi:arabinose-5-phosphate isomerase|nr:KpsF/GutQ family sugar-phosphate isomerase [Porticoccaceae bacterium]
MSEPTDYLASALRTIRIEAEAINLLESRLDQSFTSACDLMLNCKGRIIVSGMGKSGHIARKIAATLASTGTPAFFVHPGEAGHGDLGMITADDVVVGISYSGGSSELITLLPVIKRLGVPLIGISGNTNSPLAKESDVHLNIEVDTEACPLNLAPTSSTTLTLVLGDCLAIALLEKRGFTAEDFAFSHPSGALGKKLLLKVGDIMHSGSEIPECHPDQPLQEALMVMTSKGLGITLIIEDEQLLGVFTDGDLRRVFESGANTQSTSMRELMSAKPKTVPQDLLAAQALGIMEDMKITAVVVVDEKDHPVGVLHMHDILRAGVI